MTTQEIDDLTAPIVLFVQARGELQTEGPPRFHEDWNHFMAAYLLVQEWLDEARKSYPKNTAKQLDVMEVDIHCAVSEINKTRAFQALSDWCKYWNEKENIVNAK